MIPYWQQNAVLPVFKVMSTLSGAGAILLTAWVLNGGVPCACGITVAAHVCWGMILATSHTAAVLLPLWIPIYIYIFILKQTLGVGARI